MMTFRELARSLDDVLRRGEIGTPVSLRLFLHLAEPDADLGSAVAVLMRLSEIAFPGDVSDVAARLNSGEQQLNVLLRMSGGQTISLTVVRGGVSAVPLNLLLVGNRGLVRLEGGDALSPPSADDVADETRRWTKQIHAALKNACPPSRAQNI